MKTRLLFLALSCLLLFAATGFAQQPEGERKAGDRMVLTINDVEYAFRWCPPGTFMMGSPASEPGRESDERQHQVTLSRGFWMLETQVTQAMWESVMKNNPSHFKGDRLPVETVSWNDSQEFITKLNELGIAPEGFRFSLPTEAQWEYACRAGTTTAFSFGNTLNANQANFGMNVGRTTEVGSYPANVWGLYDMHGNVWEWCVDVFGTYPRGTVTDPVRTSRDLRRAIDGMFDTYSRDARGGPPRTPMDLHRVLRGGRWDFSARACRSAYRYGNDPLNRSSLIGFRLALVRAE